MLALYWTELPRQALQTGLLNVAAAAAAEVAVAHLAAVADDDGSDLAAAAADLPVAADLAAATDLADAAHDYYDPVAAAVANADPADWVQVSCHAASACLQEGLDPALPD